MRTEYAFFCACGWWDKLPTKGALLLAVHEHRRECKKKIERKELRSISSSDGVATMFVASEN